MGYRSTAGAGAVRAQEQVRMQSAAKRKAQQSRRCAGLVRVREQVRVQRSKQERMRVQVRVLVRG